MNALNQVVGEHGSWGFGMCFAYLRNRGNASNYKRVWQIYKEIVMDSPRRTKKRLLKIIKEPLIAPEQPSAMRAIDFMYDTLYLTIFCDLKESRLCDFNSNLLNLRNISNEGLLQVNKITSIYLFNYA